MSASVVVTLAECVVVFRWGRSVKKRHKYSRTTLEPLSEDPGGSWKQQSNFSESEEEKGEILEGTGGKHLQLLLRIRLITGPGSRDVLSRPGRWRVKGDAVDSEVGTAVLSPPGQGPG